MNFRTFFLVVTLCTINATAGLQCTSLFVDSLLEVVSHLAQQHVRLQSKDYANESQYQMALTLFTKDSNKFFTMHPELVPKFKEAAKRYADISITEKNETKKEIVPTHKISRAAEFAYRRKLIEHLHSRGLDFTEKQSVADIILELIEMKKYDELLLIFKDGVFDPNFDGANELPLLHIVNSIQDWTYHDLLLHALVGKKGFDFNRVDFQGRTALHYSIESRDYRLSKALDILSQTDPTIKSDNGLSAIDLLIKQQRSLELFKLFYAHQGQTVEKKAIELFINDFSTIVNNNDVEQLKYFFSIPEIAEHAASSVGSTIIVNAFSNGTPKEKIKFLINKYPQHINSKGQNDMTLLAHATILKNTQLVETLLQDPSIDVNIPYFWNNVFQLNITPSLLIEVIKRKSTDLNKQYNLQEFIDFDPNEVGYHAVESNLFWHACRLYASNPELLETILRFRGEDANPNTQRILKRLGGARRLSDSSFELSPLMEAIRRSDIPLIKILLQFPKIDLHVQAGDNPLEMAKAYKNYDIVRLLTPDSEKARLVYRVKTFFNRDPKP